MAKIAKTGDRKKVMDTQQEHRLPQVLEAYPYRKAGERSRAGNSGWSLYLLLGLRILRKTLESHVEVAKGAPELGPF